MALNLQVMRRKFENGIASAELAVSAMTESMTTVLERVAVLESENAELNDRLSKLEEKKKRTPKDESLTSVENTQPTE